MGAIFISYRRGDTPGFALTLYKELGRCFNASEVFYDQEDRHHIRYGDDWFEKIRAALGTAKVFLAVIGPGWLHAADEEGNRRLCQESDIVRWEIEEALKRQVNGELKIIPILMNGAGFPKNPAELPASLVDLTKAQACPLSGNPADFDNHFEKLLECIASVPGIPRPFTSARQSPVFHIIDYNLTQYFSDPADNLPLFYQTLHETEKVTVTASAATVALHGMGGVGKTQLALKYCEDFKDEYAGVWWFRAGNLDLLEQECKYFCEVNKVNILDNEKGQSHRAVRRWMLEQPRWLLVYDNAEAQYGEHKKDNLHPLLPGGDHHILITSRSNYWEGLAKPIALDAWNEEQSLVFLRKRLAKAANNEELRQLSHALGGLPLALEQACAYINKNNFTVVAYCRELENWEDEERLLTEEESLATNYPHSVFATLSLAFHRLSDTAKELLRLCACCAPEPIPEMLFRTPTAILPESLRKVSEDELLWRKTVAALADYALVQRVPVDLTLPGEKERQTEHSLLLHRLTQAVVTHKLCELSADLPVLTKLLYAVFPRKLKSSTGWPLAKVLAPHVLSVEKYINTGHLPFELFSTVLDRLGTYYQIGPALYEQADSIFSRNLARCENLLGPDDPNTLASMNSKALIFCDMGKYRAAKELQEQLLERSRTLLGLNHPDTLADMHNLASTLLSLGDYNKAKTMQEQILEQNKKLLGLEHPETLNALSSLACTLRELGDYVGARNLHLEAFKGRKKTLGLSHRDTFTNLDNLALVYGDLGDYKKACILHKQALDKMKEILGLNHPTTLTSMCNLGVASGMTGNVHEARNLFEQVLEHRVERLGMNHPDTTKAAWNLFNVLDEIGDHASMETVFNDNLLWLLADDVELQSGDQQVVKDGLKRFIKNHTPTHSVLEVLENAVACIDDCNYMKAKELLMPVFNVMREHIDVKDPTLTAVAWYLFYSLAQLEETKIAQWIFNTHLFWLHDADPEPLDDWQQQIQKEHFSEKPLECP